jgi:hypothetical protein
MGDPIKATFLLAQSFSQTFLRFPIPILLAIMSLLKPQGMKAYRAPSLLQPHRARQALKDAHSGTIPPLIGFWHAVSSPPIIRITAQLGFDVLCLDWEHSSCNVETITQVSTNV